MALSATLEKVAEIWKKENLGLVKSLSEEEVIKAFEKLEVPIAQDVIDIYSTLGGMDDRGLDATCFSFWSIDQILKENIVTGDLTPFGDFLIYSHLYCFKFENEFTSSVHIFWGKYGTEKIADSFEEFFENYLSNPEKYYLFEREEKKI